MVARTEGCFIFDFEDYALPCYIYERQKVSERFHYLDPHYLILEENTTQSYR